MYVSRLKDITTSEEESNFQSSSAVAFDDYSLQLNGVSFRYGVNDPPIVLQATLEVPFNSTIALVGPSGTGKSTIVKLIAGILSPQGGELMIGRQKYAWVGLAKVRELIAFVTQDDTLMSGTLMENITGFEANPDTEFASACAMIAGVHSEVLKLPMRYETAVGDSGVLLSSGQRQRVCLARALYRNPKILVLDEATSHLDIRKEAEVMASLSKLEMTIVIIAHRPETVRYADTIYCLDSGRFVRLEPSPNPAASVNVSI